MKITYNWLKDFLDLRVSPHKLQDMLTMAGLEVTCLEKKGDDFVFELEITSNRPDWLSVTGIAREVAAITGKKLKTGSGFPVPGSRLSSKHRTPDTGHRNLQIKIEDKKDCPFYTARVIKGIKVASSPAWLRKRLETVGIRSVNNIVDITNYVLLETGQPLHAFDLDKIQGNTVFVRRAKKDEKITSIDGQQRCLDKDILVIADNQGAIAVAGVMGGKDSEVGSNTQDILLESAVFDGVLTRRVSRKLGLSSESSYRFERVVDWQNTENASLRAAGLICQIAGGEIVLDKATPKPKRKIACLTLNLEDAKRLLGRDYAANEVKTILTSLGFSLGKSAKACFKVKVPSFRIDVNQSVDLIEEIARISGYENIPARLPKVIPQVGISSIWDDKRKIRNILLSQGISEAVCCNLLNRQEAKSFGYSDSQLIGIANPLTVQHEVMRPSLIPGLLSRVEYNLNQRQQQIRLFEIGNIFCNNQEKACLGLAYVGEEINLLHVKGALTLLLERLEIRDFEFIKFVCEHAYYGQETSLSLKINNRILANMGMIREVVLDRTGIKMGVFAAELDLEMLFTKMNSIQRKYKPLALYPDAARDVSAVINEDIPIGEVIKKIKTSDISYLIDLNIIDIYYGKQIPSGKKGLTLSCIYRADDHTLTTQEVDIPHQKILDVLTMEFSAGFR